MKKVLFTGSTGLIGKEAVSFLQEKKFDVINLTSKNFDLTNLEQIESVIKYNKADYLLHFAWITGGYYLSNSVNNILCKKIIY